MAHAPALLGGLHRPVGPRVAAADGRAHHPHHGIGRLLQPGVRDVLHGHVPGAVHRRSRYWRGLPPWGGWTSCRGRGQPQPDPRVPDLPAGEDHAPAGLPTYGGNRRVAGLRREEVALLAGVSVDYYFDLARAAHGTTPARRRRATRQRVRPSVQRVLDAITGAPAYVRNGRADILAANRLGYALYSEIFAGPARPANTARFVFLDPRATGFFVDWDRLVERRRRPPAHLRGAGPLGRPRAVAGGVRRRARLRLPGRPAPAGEVGGDARPGGDGPDARPGVTGGPSGWRGSSRPGSSGWP
jgi:hypothetical protein